MVGNFHVAEVDDGAHLDAVVVFGNVVQVPGGGVADDVPVWFCDEGVVGVAGLFRNTRIVNGDPNLKFPVTLTLFSGVLSLSQGVS